MAKTKHKNKKKSSKNVLEKEIVVGGARLIDKAIFAKNMAIMLRSGMTINDALAIAKGQAKGKLKRIIGAVTDNVIAGNTFGDSLAEYPKIFSGMFIQVTRAGEMSGTLDSSLQNIATQLEKDNEIRSKVRGAMIYPIVILLAAFVLGMFLAFMILPQITPLFLALNTDLPLSTRMLIWFAHVIDAYGVFIIAGIVFLGFGFTWLLRQSFVFPITHWLWLHIPVVKGISKNTNLARFTRTLGMMMKSGILIESALDITADTVDNHYYKKALHKISDRIGTGISLSDNLLEYSYLFPSITVEMVNVGENSGNLDESLLYLADFYDLEVDSRTKSLATIVEPILLLVIGVIVAILALAIITPIYQITGSIGGL